MYLYLFRKYLYFIISNFIFSLHNKFDIISITDLSKKLCIHLINLINIIIILIIYTYIYIYILNKLSCIFNN